METTQIMMGLVVAVLLPRGLPYVNRSRSMSLLVSAVYGAYALAPVFWSWKFPSILFVSLLWSYVITRRWSTAELAVGRKPISMAELPARIGSVVAVPRVRDQTVIGVCAVATLLIFAAVFASHEPVAYISAKFMKTQSKADAFGMCIGWFERAFVFAFIASGQADAAALALKPM